MRNALLAVTALAVLSTSTPALATPPAEGGEVDHEAELVRRRGILKTYHRSMGVTTWISLASTTVLGTLRYLDVNGFGDPLCDSGSPIFGHDFGCGAGLRTWHLISASFTTLSYAVTRILAALMPDPYDAGADDPTLRLHRALSWVHLAGMIAMPFLGVATSLTEGKTREALGTAHLATGYATLAALSTAASLMAF